MSTRLAPMAACVGTFLLLTHLTTASVVPSHRAVLPRTGLSRIRQAVGDMAPVPAALMAVCGPTAWRGTAAH
ncbi:hypothetical protein [Streptomyces griseorubiginosus]|uniref:hypothetical protein n=1 Tax=Streptomyces griseorubiginosus TaxID=67304 RepID=UPI003659E2DF